jgi:hypothetical protein
MTYRSLSGVSVRPEHLHVVAANSNPIRWLTL